MEDSVSLETISPLTLKKLELELKILLDQIKLVEHGNARRMEIVVHAAEEVYETLKNIFEELEG